MKIIKFQQIIKFKGEINGHLDCVIDVEDQKNIKIISITDHTNNYMLDNAAHSIYSLIGMYQGSFVKKEHHEMMRTHEVLEVPSEWCEDISLAGMDLLTSISINDFFSKSFSNEEWEHIYLINDEVIQTKSYKDMDDILEKEKEFIVTKISHFDLNDIYTNLQEQEKIIRGAK